MRAIALDLSRLWLARLRTTPRGIERLEVALAAELCKEWPGDIMGVLWTPLGMRQFDRHVVEGFIDAVRETWGETRRPEDDPLFHPLRGWLLGGAQRFPAAARPAGRVRAWADTARRATSNLRSGFGRPARRELPRGAIYLNLGHLGLAAPGLAGFLAARPDLKTAVLLHDVLSVTDPQFFPEANAAYFRKVLASTAAHADLVLTTARVTAAEVSTQLLAADARSRLVGVVDISSAIDGIAPPRVDPALRERPFFVTCGTREPRKNQILLLTIWRSLSERMADPPKLILAGARGWSAENVDDMLQRCRGIRDTVAAVEGLTSPALFALMVHSRAVLMPSLAEGFGLPVAEALHLGARVVASDIPAFREIACGRADLIDPLDGRSWRDRICRLAVEPKLHRERKGEAECARPRLGHWLGEL